MYLIFVLVLTKIIAHQGCQHEQHNHKEEYKINNLIYAVAILQPDNGSGVNGIVKMISDGYTTTIQAKITGLSDGLHGFHIHEFGNLIKGCISAGPHYNPHEKLHGGPNDQERHVGDLGNVYSENGIANFKITDNLVKLNGQYSVIGRSMVVHANEDDLGKSDHPDSKSTGNAGARLACGVIGISGPFELD
ncbi:unnamed protein product [Paramecium sonneborni]|uniref:Superoxide dismutase [Cu-Zn] n=1 Tax=Paramecium sonneborni TaxID=65129 RepID=A0A8S1PGR3_9CILI|nr:unnamed protein product [Paramecium sonneborni]